MKFKTLFLPLSLALLLSCSDDSFIFTEKEVVMAANEETGSTGPLAGILGVWKIQRINNQACQSENCVDSVQYANSQDLTLEVTNDSVFYHPSAIYPEMFNRCIIHSFKLTTEMETNSPGTWLFVVDESKSSMTVVRTRKGEQGMIYNDILDVYRSTLPKSDK